MAEKKQKKVKKKFTFSRQTIFISLAIILFALIIWFSINNFVFIIQSLNDTFGSDVQEAQSQVEFDKETFDSLGIIN